MKPLEEILCPEARGVLSLTGGGGKTSLMFHLARQLARSGKRVLTTTTTKILPPAAEQSEALLICPDPETVLQQALSHMPKPGDGGPGPKEGDSRGCHVTAVADRAAESGKLLGFSPEAISIFWQSGIFDWILVEADGASRRPLKASAEHEPVVPLETTVLVSVAGLEVVNQSFSERLVFRSEIAAPFMGLSEGETITESSLARLFAHPHGAFKGAPPSARCYIFLNKADTPARRNCGARVAQQLLQLATPARALIVGQALPELHLHAVYPLEGSK